MAVNWPDNPVDGDIHTEEGTTWVYKDPPGAWRIASFADPADFVLKAGDTIKGRLVLAPLATDIALQLGYNSGRASQVFEFFADGDDVRTGYIQSHDGGYNALGTDDTHDWRIPGQTLPSSDSIVTRALGDARWGGGVSEGVIEEVLLSGKTSQELVLPTDVTEFHVMISNVSSNTNFRNFEFQLSDEVGGYKTSGYMGVSHEVNGYEFSTSFRYKGSVNLAQGSHSLLHFMKAPSVNRWFINGSIGSTPSGFGHLAGQVLLDGRINGVRINHAGGSGAWDAGEISVRYKKGII